MTAEPTDIIAHSDSTDIASAAKPQWLQKRLDWFMDQRFGCIIHGGPTANGTASKSWPLVPPTPGLDRTILAPWIEREKDLEPLQP